MAMDELLEGTALTGRQAAIIFFSFLCLIFLAAILLIVFSDFFRGLIAIDGSLRTVDPRRVVAVL
ncbi:hypothetical protein [Natrinema ejinorense]|uniref:Uncharacterized protein n=1 Tax=Natrinema ejinorense TaxID=373386 RepID=A0A2A5QRS4_9EURY|nr:hypothetical protein [Natrinema ejinorense]PCR89505.1 hypothetical protein CP557_02540 [Natrinema ejinorense]